MSNVKNKPNKLIDETSPYLLQHAYNPVNWYPWGEEAFEKAAAEEKPVFLSIGYSTCHWCHVMEEESFEDREIADYLNEHFVCVKVDKEERPDLDSIYMNVCQAFTGSGGWPMTIFLTPEQKPFYGGTYFPKVSKYGQPGLVQILPAIANEWKSNKEDLYRSGEKVIEGIKRVYCSGMGEKTAGKEAIQEAYRQFAGSFDEKWGGFGAAPKFPSPHNLMFLLRFYHYEGETEALRMAERTLIQMYKGGLYDHLGGGFSRYATDEKWLVPHFEKMLYDNALLVSAYLETYQITENSIYLDIAEETLEYVKREMTSEEGGFYSAQDADAQGEEGKFYVFTKEEIMTVLGPVKGEVFCKYYGVSDEGNFEGKNILNRLHETNEIIEISLFDEEKEKLRKYREDRMQLHKDDKILVSWNALMIAAFAKAYKVSGKAEYLATAEKAYGYLLKYHEKEKGRLLISSRNNKAKGEGVLDDYAFLILAELELYECSFDPVYLQHAIDRGNVITELFESLEGGYYLNSAEGETLVYRPKEKYDGAVPSGNSAVLYIFAKLWAYTGDKNWEAAWEKQIIFYEKEFQDMPQAHTFALAGLMLYRYPTAEAVCISRKANVSGEIAALAGRYFHPEYIIHVKTAETKEKLEKTAPFVRAFKSDKEEEYTIYHCENHTCSRPFHKLEQLKEKLKK